MKDISNPKNIQTEKKESIYISLNSLKILLDVLYVWYI